MTKDTIVVYNYKVKQTSVKGEMMDTKDLISIRESDGGIVRLEPHECLSSTVSLAREYARAGYPDRYAVFCHKKLRAVAEGKSEIEYDEGLFLSIILRPSIFPSQAAYLGAISGLSMLTALRDHTSSRLDLGWVSDLYCEGVRIGHASIEGKLDNYTTYEYIIVSFDIKLSKKHFPPRLSDMVRKVFESENTSISMIIAKNLIARFFNLYSKIKTPSAFMDGYVENFAQRGMRIKRQVGERKRVCKILGVDQKTGALTVEDRRGNRENLTSPIGVYMPKRIKLTKQEKNEQK